MRKYVSPVGTTQAYLDTLQSEIQDAGFQVYRGDPRINGCPFDFSGFEFTIDFIDKDIIIISPAPSSNVAVLIGRGVQYSSSGLRYSPSSSGGQLISQIISFAGGAPSILEEHTALITGTSIPTAIVTTTSAIAISQDNLTSSGTRVFVAISRNFAGLLPNYYTIQGLPVPLPTQGSQEPFTINIGRPSANIGLATLSFPINDWAEDNPISFQEFLIAGTTYYAMSYKQIASRNIYFCIY